MYFSTKILIVEESQLEATQIQAMLEDRGLHSSWVATGETALAAARPQRKGRRTCRGTYSRVSVSGKQPSYAIGQQFDAPPHRFLLLTNSDHTGQ
jgi:hypothetical protein